MAEILESLYRSTWFTSDDDKERIRRAKKRRDKEAYEANKETNRDTRTTYHNSFRNRAIQPVYVQEIGFDALIESTESYSAEAPEYPTEDGTAIMDTMVLEALQVDMTLYVTDTPVTWASEFDGENRVDTVVNELIALYQSKQIITVETTDKTYTDMVIESMSISKTTEQGYAREIPITFKQVTITETKTAEISESYYRSTGTTSTGNASTTEGEETKSTGTALYNLGKSTGLLDLVGQ